MSHSTDIWMPLYIGDYLAATQHLSAEQSGAYLHLLMHQWKTGPLPVDLEIIRRVARVERDAWGSAWALLEHFFTRTEAGYIQNRLEREKKISQEKQESTTLRAKAAAAKRWPQKTPDAELILEHPASTTQAMPKQCPSPSPSPSPLHKSKEQKPLALTALALPAIDSFLTVTLNDGRDFPISEAKVSEWISLYPGIDVRQELRNYKAWAINNPTQRKTRSGIFKSINFWLGKAQNQSRPTKGEINHGTHTATAGPATIRQQRSNDAIDAAARFFTHQPIDSIDEAGEGQLPSNGNLCGDGDRLARPVGGHSARLQPPPVHSRSEAMPQGEAVLAAAR